jgi:hypothetical protein
MSNRKIKNKFIKGTIPITDLKQVISYQSSGHHSCLKEKVYKEKCNLII